MKKLFMIGGTMGVGKTTACQVLKRKLNNAVFLDGDWCWDADPFQVNDETKAMVVDNICHLLNNFIRCTAYDNVIFCWVMHEQSIIDSILAGLDTNQCEVQPISLVCNESALRNRIQADIHAGKRQPDVLERSLERMSKYAALNTIKVDVSERTPEEAADVIMAL
jgi:broad-specificity NMP kinase